jgi:hypothetical protein
MEMLSMRGKKGEKWKSGEPRYSRSKNAIRITKTMADGNTKEDCACGKKLTKTTGHCAMFLYVLN